MAEKIRKKYLTTHIKARKYLNQLLNNFRAEPDPDVQRYRAETYMLRTLLEFFEFEKQIEIEEHILEIKELLEQCGISES